MEDEVLMNWKNYIGKVAEIVAMEIMDTEQKGLRHPRFLNWRPDKDPKDCQYEDIFGKQIYLRMRTIQKEIELKKEEGVLNAFFFFMSNEHLQYFVIVLLSKHSYLRY